MLLVVFFFFFQAEDGIRDLTVTGVQTCALPISESARVHCSWIWSRYRRAASRACTKVGIPSSFFGKKSKYSRHARLALFITAGCFVSRYSLWYDSAV